MSLTNAHDELIEFIKDNKLTLIAAEIYCHGVKVIHPLNNPGSFFIELAAINYDRGYGGQELYGTLWFTDNAWAERGEYDGAEWWELRKLPPIPDSLCIPE